MKATTFLQSGDRAILQAASVNLIRNNTAMRADLTTSRKESEYDTKSYRDGLQRAFNNAKQKVFFNPDMIYFVTLTYKGTEHTPDEVLRDLKIFFKKQRALGYQPKYIAVMEYQKRGSIHVHLVTNKEMRIEKNRNGYFHLPDWRKGFSSVLSIGDFDDNFRPYLYLFKYMKKSRRIGKSFLYSSRNLANSVKLPVEYFDVKLFEEVAVEKTRVQLLDGRVIYYSRHYLKSLEPVLAADQTG